MKKKKKFTIYHNQNIKFIKANDNRSDLFGDKKSLGRRQFHDDGFTRNINLFILVYINRATVISGHDTTTHWSYNSR